MRSASARDDAVDPDRTARARIRDAAIDRVARDGVAGTSIRAIAEDADVSPALVLHHFGSKAELVRSCDEHVAATIRRGKQAAMAAGSGLDPVAALRSTAQGPPLLRYLARRLTAESAHAASLVDEMVADALSYMTTGVETGLLVPSDDPAGRAAVLTLWSLGAVVLHEHARRLLGVDLLDDPAAAQAYLSPALELLSGGLLTEDAAAQMRQAITPPDDQQEMP